MCQSEEGWPLPHVVGGAWVTTTEGTFELKELASELLKVGRVTAAPATTTGLATSTSSSRSHWHVATSFCLLCGRHWW